MLNTEHVCHRFAKMIDLSMGLNVSLNYGLKKGGKKNPKTLYTCQNIQLFQQVDTYLLILSRTSWICHWSFYLNVYLYTHGTEEQRKDINQIVCTWLNSRTQKLWSQDYQIQGAEQSDILWDLLINSSFTGTAAITNQRLQYQTAEVSRLHATVSAIAVRMDKDLAGFFSSKCFPLYRFCLFLSIFLSSLFSH